MFNRTKEEVLKLIETEGVEIVDLRFPDLLGSVKHLSIPAHALIKPETFDEGVGFDGSSIRGFQHIDESDMLLFPDPNTAFIDPFRDHKTLNIYCFIHDPITGEAYSRDPRNVARKAEAYIKETGIADIAYFGPESEFFIFDDVRYSQDNRSGFYKIDSIEGAWNTDREELDNLGYKLGYKEGYFALPPSDHLQDIRSEMMLVLERIGIPTEVQHHEVATAGQGEIPLRFDSLLNMADKVTVYRYVVKSVAREAGFTATFMPKPLFADNGSGMHTHQSLWKDGQPLFAGDGYAGLSDTGRYYIGGLLAHASSLVGLAAASTNSYKRLVPGYEAPVNLVYSQRNRSAACRIPVYSKSPKAKRVEFRCPDSTGNPYLAFAAMAMAGIDGIQNKIEPPEPVDKDLFELSKEELAKIKSVPSSLEAALDALENDHEYLLKGNVFTMDLIETWLGYKRTNEVDAVRLRPHPYEFVLYYDI